MGRPILDELSSMTLKRALYRSLDMEDTEVEGRKVTIDIVKANVFAVVIFVVSAIVFLVPFFYIWRGTPIERLMGTYVGSFIFLVGVLVGIVVHELIHGLTWACFAKSGWKSISFGVMWKLLTPYCHCNEPMRIPIYMWGAMMPCIILGVIPAVLSLFVGNLLLLVFGVIFIAGAAGDIWMTWLLTKENPRSLVLDHPSEAGFYIIDEED